MNKAQELFKLTAVMVQMFFSPNFLAYGVARVNLALCFFVLWEPFHHNTIQ